MVKPKRSARSNTEDSDPVSLSDLIEELRKFRLDMLSDIDATINIAMKEQLSQLTKKVERQQSGIDHLKRGILEHKTWRSPEKALV